jgi:hypothetical protein
MVLVTMAVTLYVNVIISFIRVINPNKEKSSFTENEW